MSAAVAAPSYQAMRLALRLRNQLAAETPEDRAAVLLGLVGAEFGDHAAAELRALLAEAEAAAA